LPFMTYTVVSRGSSASTFGGVIFKPVTGMYRPCFLGLISMTALGLKPARFIRSEKVTPFDPPPHIA